jgi:hypothetical protein
MDGNSVDQHLSNCHLHRGHLLEVSPSNPISEIIAKQMKDLFQFGALYAGKFSACSGAIFCKPLTHSEMLKNVKLFAWDENIMVKWKCGLVLGTASPLQKFPTI